MSLEQLRARVAGAIANHEHTITSLAAAAGVKRDTVYDLLRGRETMTWRTVTALIRAVGGSISIEVPGVTGNPAAAQTARDAKRLAHRAQVMSRVVHAHSQGVCRRRIASTVGICPTTVTRMLDEAQVWTPDTYDRRAARL